MSVFVIAASFPSDWLSTWAYRFLALQARADIVIVGQLAGAPARLGGDKMDLLLWTVQVALARSRN